METVQSVQFRSWSLTLDIDKMWKHLCSLVFRRREVVSDASGWVRSGLASHDGTDITQVRFPKLAWLHRGNCSKCSIQILVSDSGHRQNVEAFVLPGISATWSVSDASGWVRSGLASHDGTDITQVRFPKLAWLHRGNCSKCSIQILVSDSGHRQNVEAFVLPGISATWSVSDASGWVRSGLASHDGTDITQVRFPKLAWLHRGNCSKCSIQILVSDSGHRQNVEAFVLPGISATWSVSDASGWVRSGLASHDGTDITQVRFPKLAWLHRGNCSKCSIQILVSDSGHRQNVEAFVLPGISATWSVSDASGWVRSGLASHDGTDITQVRFPKLAWLHRGNCSKCSIQILVSDSGHRQNVEAFVLPGISATWSVSDASGWVRSGLASHDGTDITQVRFPKLAWLHRGNCSKCSIQILVSDSGHRQNVEAFVLPGISATWSVSDASGWVRSGLASHDGTDITQVRFPKLAWLHRGNCSKCSIQILVSDSGHRQNVEAFVLPGISATWSVSDASGWVRSGLASHDGTDITQVRFPKLAWLHRGNCSKCSIQILVSDSGHRQNVEAFVLPGISATWSVSDASGWVRSGLASHDGTDITQVRFPKLAWLHRGNCSKCSIQILVSDSGHRQNVEAFVLPGISATWSVSDASGWVRSGLASHDGTDITQVRFPKLAWLHRGNCSKCSIQILVSDSGHRQNVEAFVLPGISATWSVSDASGWVRSGLASHDGTDITQVRFPKLAWLHRGNCSKCSIQILVSDSGHRQNVEAFVLPGISATWSVSDASGWVRSGLASHDGTDITQVRFPKLAWLHRGNCSKCSIQILVSDSGHRQNVEAFVLPGISATWSVSDASGWVRSGLASHDGTDITQVRFPKLAWLHRGNCSKCSIQILVSDSGHRQNVEAFVLPGISATWSVSDASGWVRSGLASHDGTDITQVRFPKLAWLHRGNCSKCSIQILVSDSGHRQNVEAFVLPGISATWSVSDASGWVRSGLASHDGTDITQVRFPKLAWLHHGNCSKCSIQILVSDSGHRQNVEAFVLSGISATWSVTATLQDESALDWLHMMAPISHKCASQS